MTTVKSSFYQKNSQDRNISKKKKAKTIDSNTKRDYQVTREEEEEQTILIKEAKERTKIESPTTTIDANNNNNKEYCNREGKVLDNNHKKKFSKQNCDKNTPVEQQQQQQQQQQQSNSTSGHQFVDSRSILTNKEKLKQFWEHKMELEFKLKKDKESSYPAVAQQALERGKRQTNGCKIIKKQPTFDENNNNIYTNDVNNGSNGNGMVSTSDNNNNSDEDWKAETSDKTNGRSKVFASNRQQLSAELVCEKLRKYQVANADFKELEATQQQQQQDDDALHVKGSKQQKQVPLERKTKSSNGHHKQATSTTTNATEIQLMSIDPTLCHSQQQQAKEKDNLLTFSNEANTDDNNQHGEDHLSSMINSNSDNNREEQIINEEFSSSTNSSFGPMSISIPHPSSAANNKSTRVCGDTKLTSGCDLSPNDNKTNSDQVKFEYQEQHQLAEEQEEEEEEENSSAQSGSVLTVITKTLEQNNSFSEQPTSSTLTSNNQNNNNNVTSVEDEEEFSSSIISLSKNGEPANQINFGDEQREQQYSSNIGVAFESLQFDSEIKSSKEEKVDEQYLLLGNAAQQQTPSTLAPDGKDEPVARKANRFNSREVKSVCSFITAAISDATRQVEKYMNNGNQKINQQDSFGANDDNNRLENSSSSIRRATFVQEDQEEEEEEEEEQEEEEEEGAEATSLDMLKSSSIVSKNKKFNELESYENDNNSIEAYEDEDELDNADEHVPKADLSSIFEANVKREIQRFEFNSNQVKRVASRKLSPSSNGFSNGNNETERKIAEEIRLFNEREMELKQRHGSISSSSNSSKQNSVSNLASSSLSTTTTTSNNTQQVDGNELAKKQKQQQQQTETIVRFGKTLKIPKAAKEVFNKSVGNLHQFSTNRAATGGIKLTTTCSSNNQPQQQQTTTISMHKFISSGGKRFVFTSTSSSCSSNSSSTSSCSTKTRNAHITPSSNALVNSAQFTSKSLSNLSTTTNNNNNNSAATFSRPVDYKAIDSLNFKEIPNVKPGITKKVIETFTRLTNNNSSSELHSNANKPTTIAITTNSDINGNCATRQQQQNGLSSQMSSTLSSCSSSSPSPGSSSFDTNKSSSLSSAELKIQEELRDMRAREAELRSQRSLNTSRQQQQQQQQQKSKKDEDLHSEDRTHVGNSKQSTLIGGGPAAAALDDDDDQIRLDNKNSNESLFPIKQAIDSFRKLNSQTIQQQQQQQQKPSNNNDHLQAGSQKKRQQLQKKPLNGHQPIMKANDTDEAFNYDSRVGGQRRRISLDMWENGAIH